MNVGFCLILIIVLAVARPALCQDLQWQRGPSRSLYVCPGLVATAFGQNPERSFPVLSQGSPCPCYPEGAKDVKVALGDPYLLLSLPGVHIDYPRTQCRWYREFEKKWKRWEVTYGRDASWLRTLCGIQQALPGQICFREVKKAAIQQVEHWTAAFIQDPANSTRQLTSLGTVSLDVVTRCTANADCPYVEVCDDGLHYCRHACDGPKGGTRHCTSTIGERATCQPEYTMSLRFKCECKAPFVEEFATDGSLVNCKDRPCLEHNQCKLDEVCLLASSSAEPDKQYSSTRKTCIKVCSEADNSAPLCGRNQRCRPVKGSNPATSAAHRGECVCISSANTTRHYYPLPDNSRCEEAHIDSNRPKIQVEILDNKTQESPAGSYRLLDPAGIDNPRSLITEPTSNNGTSMSLTVVRGDTVKLTCLVQDAFPPALVALEGNHAAKSLIREISGPQQNPYRGGATTHWQDYWVHATLGINSSASLPIQSAGDVLLEEPTLTCNASHVKLGEQGSAAIHLHLHIFDCAKDSDCSVHQQCQQKGDQRKCVDVCADYSRCDSAKNNEECKQDAVGPHLHAVCKDICDAHPCDLATTKCKPRGNNGTRICECLDGSHYPLDDTRCQALVQPPFIPDVYIDDTKLECANVLLLTPTANIPCIMPQAVKTDVETVMKVTLKQAFPAPKLRLLPAGAGISSVDNAKWNISSRKDQESRTSDGKLAFTYTLLLNVKLGSLGNHTDSFLLELEHPSFKSRQQKLGIEVRLNLADETSDSHGLTLDTVLFGCLLGLCGLLTAGNIYIHGPLLKKSTENGAAI